MKSETKEQSPGRLASRFCPEDWCKIEVVETTLAMSVFLFCVRVEEWVWGSRGSLPFPGRLDDHTRPRTWAGPPAATPTPSPSHSAVRGAAMSQDSLLESRLPRAAEGRPGGGQALKSDGRRSNPRAGAARTPGGGQVATD
ncbi:uncharacterized protein RHO17_025591 [Thomomys bottae]